MTNSSNGQSKFKPKITKHYQGQTMKNRNEVTNTGRPYKTSVEDGMQNKDLKKLPKKKVVQLCKICNTDS